MSIQNGHPTSIAVFSIARRLNRAGNSPFASEYVVMRVYCRKSRGS